MTYSAVVLVAWIVALAGTCAGLVVAVRSLARAETASRAATASIDGLSAVETATEVLEASVTDTAHAQVRLHSRAAG